MRLANRSTCWRRARSAELGLVNHLQSEPETDRGRSKVVCAVLTAPDKSAQDLLSGSEGSHSLRALSCDSEILQSKTFFIAPYLGQLKDFGKKVGALSSPEPII